MKKIIIILTLLLCSSCVSLIMKSEFKRYGFYDEKSKVHYLSNNTKEVAFIGMHHVGRKEFYTDVASKIDSLKKQGYLVFYEGVETESGTDSLTADVQNRKLRKLIGSTVGEYLDTLNNKFLGKYKISKKFKMMMQPASSELNIDTIQALRADVSFKTLVNEFEKKYYKIELDSCDFNTSLNSKTYDCELIEKKLRTTFFDETVLELRDQNLARKILEHQGNKIVIVFGSLHLTGMMVELRKTDSKWHYLMDKINK